MIGALFLHVQNCSYCLRAAAEQMITENITEDNQKNSQKAAVDKKHDCHADGNPEQDESNQSFHGRLLSYKIPG